MDPPPAPPTGPGDQPQPARRRHRPRPHNRANHPGPNQNTNQGHAPPEGVELSQPLSQPDGPPRAQRQRGRGRADGSVPASASQAGELHTAVAGLQISDGPAPEGQEEGHKRRRRRPKKHGPEQPESEKKRDASTGPSASSNTGDVDDTVHASSSSVPAPKNDRRKRFGAALTTPSDPVSAPAPAPSGGSRSHAYHAPPANADLTTRLTHSITHPPYADCPICFSALHPAQPIWSCTPSPGIPSNCWTPFHLRCIREWAGKSVKETREAWLARGEERQGEWRCPGCQTRRTEVPREYRCFCGRLAGPGAGRMSTPHSCGESCSRKREKCEHPCPLLCHPGPCPPCVVTVQRPCYCGKKLLAWRCSHLTGAHPPEMTCAQTCGRPLNCGKHTCESECHPGDCAPCGVRETVRCYCGKETKEVACGEGEALACVDLEKGMWEGRYECSHPCGRPFKCGIHTCQEHCHPPPAVPLPCPTDLELITTCPCTQTPLADLPNGKREKCTDPIPTCGKVCSKLLQGCDHLCPQPCHLGPCPPCVVPLSLSCRCGETVRVVPCSQATSSTNANTEILCDRPCRALRHCGRHICSRLCCPLAWQGKVSKGKRKALEQALLGRPEDDREGWHDCDIICGKLLTCRKHNCTLPDHRGACPSCLQSSFEELVCHCGRTVLMPPIPCGTVIDCPFPCSRAAPPCGHPKTQHTCHEEGECPPCPFLTTKRCACGKTLVPNVRCSQENVGCGTVCGKLLDCGFHSCEKLCHSGECEPCSQVCGKPRKLCKHPCPVQCHAPSACPETEPCPAQITLICACGRLKQQALCGACTGSPTSRASTQLKCGQECAVAKRNARLAEALGISEGTKSKLAATDWPERLVTFFRENREWASMAERNLNEFIQGPKKTQLLPPMVSARQRFMHEMANIYRLDVDYVDSGPNRSAQLVRRVDSRIPTPMISEVATPPAPPVRPAGAGLVSLNRLRPAASPAVRGWGVSSPKPTSAAAVVAAPPPVATTPVSAWGTPSLRPAVSNRSSTPAASSSHVSTPSVPAPSLEHVRDSWEDD